MGTVALSNRTQLFVSSHLLLAANACSASLSPQSLARRPKPTASVLAQCCSTLWVQLHAAQPHPSPRLSSLTLWVPLHATQLHPSPRLSSLSHLLSLSGASPRASVRYCLLLICRSPQTTMKPDARSTLGEKGSTLWLTTTKRRPSRALPPKASRASASPAPPISKHGYFFALQGKCRGRVREH